MQEIQLYFTKLTIIGLGINDACVLVSLIPMGPAESAYLSNILSLVQTVEANVNVSLVLVLISITFH